MWILSKDPPCSHHIDSRQNHLLSLSYDCFPRTSCRPTLLQSFLYRLLPKAHFLNNAVHIRITTTAKIGPFTGNSMMATTRENRTIKNKNALERFRFLQKTQYPSVKRPPKGPKILRARNRKKPPICSEVMFFWRPKEEHLNVWFSTSFSSIVTRKIG